MNYIENILEEMYEKIGHKEMFLPLTLANSIICYKLAYYDKGYWMDFCKESTDPELHMETIDDIYNFFGLFLTEMWQFQYSYRKRIQDLKKFEDFFSEFFFKQKFFFKHPQELTKQMKKCIIGIPDPQLLEFTREIFDITSRIRFL